MHYLIDRVRIAPDKQIVAHTQQSYELSYIIKGSGECILGESRDVFSAGELVLVPPGMRHQWIFDVEDVDDEGCIVNITLIFTRVFLEHLAESFPFVAPCVLKLLELREAVLFQGEAREQLADQLELMADSDEWEQIQHLISIIRLISEADESVVFCNAGRGRSVRERMEKVRVYLSCNYYRKVSLGELSSYVGMNRTSFCKFFRQMSGKTYVQWLTDFRLEKAKEMLSLKEYSVSEIADACGFESLPHFTRTFTRCTGLSPSAFRSGRQAEQGN